MHQELTSSEVARIAEEAYTFSFPMLMGYRFAYATFLEPTAPSYRGEPNEMHGTAVTLNYRFRDVITPNADTPYSMAFLDLRAEPVVVEVPAVEDRCYVLQFEDLYGMNAHYVGSRATGVQPGTYLAVGPNWDDETPPGVDAVLAFEIEFVFIIGRTQIFGPDDVPALSSVMSDYRIRPLSAHLGEPAPDEAPDVAWPVWDDPASRDERSIRYLNLLLHDCQPHHPSETELMDRFAQIGIGPNLPFGAEALDDGTRAALRAGIDAARESISAKVGSLGRPVNGWTTAEALGSRDSSRATTCCAPQEQWSAGAATTRSRRSIP